MNYQIFVTVWGREYVAKFLQYSLTSQLLPKNLRELSQYAEIVYRIYTDKESHSYFYPDILKLEKFANRSNRFAAVIHKSCREKKFYICSIHDDRGKFAKKFSFNSKIVAIGFAKMMQKYNASIMPISFMLWAWVPQTHNQFDWLIRHHFRP